MGTFQGLELSKRALFAQQGALYTTGHNIANVNTDGYSRQRVNFETTTPFPVPSRVMPQYPGQVGTGVDIGTVERIRNKFLDMQFRSENSRHEYWRSEERRVGKECRSEGGKPDGKDVGRRERAELRRMPR